MALLMAAFGLPSLCAPQSVFYRQQDKRTLSGSVANGKHEPLSGAVVQVEDIATLNIITYIVGRNGLYRFRHLDGEADYRTWATYRGERSKTKTLSHFDSNKPQVFVFIISGPQPARF